jgi:hypothetical protein
MPFLCSSERHSVTSQKTWIPIYCINYQIQTKTYLSQYNLHLPRWSSKEDKELVSKEYKYRRTNCQKLCFSDQHTISCSNFVRTSTYSDAFNFLYISNYKRKCPWRLFPLFFSCYSVGTGRSFFRRWRSRIVNLNTHLPLVPRLNWEDLYFHSHISLHDIHSNNFTGCGQ